MTIWVDADACPAVVREILYRAAERTGTELVLVANQPVRTPPSRRIRSVQVPAGIDRADQEIEQRVAAGDLVITADVPLAAAVVEKGAAALSPRGRVFSPETIREDLNMRDFGEGLRESGVRTGGPPPLGQRERQAFANALDRHLARARRSG
jgi:hypothetical protein